MREGRRDWGEGEEGNEIGQKGWRGGMEGKVGEGKRGKKGMREGREGERGRKRMRLDRREGGGGCHSYQLCIVPQQLLGPVHPLEKLGCSENLGGGGGGKAVNQHLCWPPN